MSFDEINVFQIIRYNVHLTTIQDLEKSGILGKTCMIYICAIITKCNNFLAIIRILRKGEFDA